MDKLPLRSMGYPLGSLTMDPTKGGLALQEASTQHSLQQLSYDPSFAERAAKYSTFGSANYASQRGSSQPGYSSFDTGKLRDVLENENITKANIPRSASFSGSQLSEDETKPKTRSASPGVEAIEGAKAAASDGAVTTSQENSSGSQPLAPPTTQRKRKGSATSSAVEGKGAKEPTTSAGVEINSTEKNTDSKTSEQTSLKRQRSGTSNDAKNKAERSASENSGDSSPRSLKGATSKPPKDELPKQDYIHVRARRGQATDSHSLAERVRREKISERMKFLQDLVPGCSKVTGKAVMLDEIINYVQSLQRQIEFLSMKLAAVNPRMEYSYDVLGKDMLHSRSPETTLLGPEPLPGYGDFHGQVHPMHMAPTVSHLDMHRDMRGVDSGLCDAYLRRSMSVPSMASLVSADDHFDPLSQAVSLCNGDLQSVVEMGFIQGRQGLGLGTHLSHGSSLCMTGKLKVEM